MDLRNDETVIMFIKKVILRTIKFYEVLSKIYFGGREANTQNPDYDILKGRLPTFKQYLNITTSTMSAVLFVALF